MHPRRVAGGDTLRGSTSNVRGSTDGREAQSAVSARNTSLKRKPREQAMAYLKPDEIRSDAVSVQIDSRGRVHMVTYRIDN